MKYTNEMMLMISKFLYGELDAEKFSFDFPARLSFIYDEFLKENRELCDYLEDEMPEVCQWYDPHNTGEPGVYNLDTFRKKVYEVYFNALPMTQRLKKIS